MATVFMKWLETTPERYDQGIRLLTLNRLPKLKAHIATQLVNPGDRVLEIGCGTGTLAIMMAQRGAIVTGVDESPWMMAQARRKVAEAGLEAQVTLQEMEASTLTDHLPPNGFDVIVSTLAFSELPDAERRFVLAECATLLAPGGRLIIGDEVVPAGVLARMGYYLVRLPLVLITWLLTRASTTPLRHLSQELTEAGFAIETIATYLAGSLAVFVAHPLTEAETGLAKTIPRLRYKITWRTLLIDAWALIFRIIPPYPKIKTGLYAIGNPNERSPVLVTGNFELTVRRVVRELDEKVDVWLLVADSAGINVWCAAGGGYFTAEKVIGALKSARLEQVVRHHALILPQLCANGVDGWKVRQETGWGVHWGPVRARDIPAYLAAQRKKTDAMRWVRFPLKDRLEMVTVTLGFYGLLILLPVFLFWRTMFWPVTVSLVGLSYFYAIMMPWLPGRDGMAKSIPLAVIALAGLLIYTVWQPLAAPHLFNWVIGLVGLSIFTAAELQGMSPLMRGEQANWGREAIIGVILGAVYWLTPMLVGWR